MNETKAAITRVPNFRAVGVSCGLKESGNPDLALVEDVADRNLGKMRVSSVGLYDEDTHGGLGVPCNLHVPELRSNVERVRGPRLEVRVIPLPRTPDNGTARSLVPNAEDEVAFAVDQRVSDRSDVLQELPPTLLPILATRPATAWATVRPSANASS